MNTFYEITYNTDRTEGKGAQRSTGFMAPEHIALEILKSPTYCNNFGAMGCPGGKWDIKKYEAPKPPTIVNSVAEFEQAFLKTERDKALAKLTATEKKALGLA